MTWTNRTIGATGKASAARQALCAIATIAVILLGSGCATTVVLEPPVGPEWYETKVAPDNDDTNCYFVAFSSDGLTAEAARSAAEERARAEVAAFLQTEVHRVFTFSSDYAPVEGSDGARVEEEMREELVTRVDTTVKGCRIAEHFAQCRVEFVGSRRRKILGWRAGALAAYPQRKLTEIEQYQRKLEELRLKSLTVLPEAEGMFRAGDTEEAIDLLRRGIVDYPNTILLRTRLAGYHAAAGQHGEAMRQWRVIADHPDVSRAVAEKARVEIAVLQSAILSRYLTDAVGNSLSRRHFDVLRRHIAAKRLTDARRFVKRQHDVKNDAFALRLLSIIAAEEYRVLKARGDGDGGCDMALWWVSESESALRLLNREADRRDELKALVLSKLLGVHDETVTDGLQQLQERTQLSAVMDAALGKLYGELFSGCGIDGVDPHLWPNRKEDDPAGADSGGS